jgi:CRP-like cAMP-binding protein
LVQFLFAQVEEVSAFEHAVLFSVDVRRIRRGLETKEIERLAADGRLEHVGRREIVPLDGPTLAVVVAGYFRIFRHAAFVRDVTLGLAGRGDVLAPGAAFGDRSAETGAEALCDARLLRLSSDAWQTHAERDPEINLKLAAAIARRITRLQKKLEEISRVGVEGRVASALLDLAADFGVTAADTIRLDVPLSQDDLASLAGTTRETCSSAVAKFARRGLVRGGRLNGMLVLDVPGLQALTQT